MLAAISYTMAWHDVTRQTTCTIMMSRHVPLHHAMQHDPRPPRCMCGVLSRHCMQALTGADRPSASMQPPCSVIMNGHGGLHGHCRCCSCRYPYLPHQANLKFRFELEATCCSAPPLRGPEHNSDSGSDSMSDDSSVLFS